MRKKTVFMVIACVMSAFLGLCASTIIYIKAFWDNPRIVNVYEVNPPEDHKKIIGLEKEILNDSNNLGSDTTAYLYLYYCYDYGYHDRNNLELLLYTFHEASKAFEFSIYRAGYMLTSIATEMNADDKLNDILLCTDIKRFFYNCYFEENKIELPSYGYYEIFGKDYSRTQKKVMK